ncbi:MAG: hypothetical protein OEW68_08850 [Gammaproteobacteria bacterium]|nr:hypothetical protein [Gammaproteobacteria bacterium]MDH4314935.1 hypothetical protein [Gammaproteobacteria bacterium]MDH5214184.1 hypothetical protein [Gammaproteobacteria bacterium]MDH5500875.1 hypothetical protein [Gammaproteobacteria bacterium]
MDIIEFGVGATRIGLFGLVLGLAGCGGGGDTGGPDCRYNENWINGQCTVNWDLTPAVIPDGIWRGTDASGADVVALISRHNTLRYVDGIGRIGSGTVSVGTNNILGSGFELVTAYGDTFPDGSTVADCFLSGTLVEQQSITASKECTTRAGLEFDEQLTLTFDPLYNRSSSLATVAGQYQTMAGDVLNIASDGAMFLQNASTGCVINGQVSTVVSFANMYGVSYSIDGCTGPDAAWNGSNFEGLAMLEGQISAGTLLIALSGEVASVPVGIVEEARRL